MRLYSKFPACLIFALALIAASIAQPARALTLLRDPDIEHALKQLAAPILQAAGLNPGRTSVLVIDDRNLNAFVVDRDNIFIHSGLLLKMETPQMLQSVLAHDAAHIANRHLVRRPQNMRNARTAAGLGMALAAASGAVSGNARPDDPFYHELRGQILMESRQFAAATNAYARAVNAPPNHPLILGSYGRALVAQGQHPQALQEREKARVRDGRNARVMRDPAVAYAKSGQNRMASLVTAERYAMTGRLEDAEIHATRALGLLPNESGGWQRAQDVLSAAKAARR